MDELVKSLEVRDCGMFETPKEIQYQVSECRGNKKERESGWGG